MTTPPASSSLPTHLSSVGLGWDYTPSPSSPKITDTTKQRWCRDLLHAIATKNHQLAQDIFAQASMDLAQITSKEFSPNWLLSLLENFDEEMFKVFIKHGLDTSLEQEKTNPSFVNHMMRQPQALQWLLTHTQASPEAWQQVYVTLAGHGSLVTMKDRLQAMTTIVEHQGPHFRAAFKPNQLHKLLTNGLNNGSDLIMEHVTKMLHDPANPKMADGSIWRPAFELLWSHAVPSQDRPCLLVKQWPLFQQWLLRHPLLEQEWNAQVTLQQQHAASHRTALAQSIPYEVTQEQELPWLNVNGATRYNHPGYMWKTFKSNMGGMEAFRPSLPMMLYMRATKPNQPLFGSAISYPEFPPILSKRLPYATILEALLFEGHPDVQNALSSAPGRQAILSSLQDPVVMSRWIQTADHASIALMLKKLPQLQQWRFPCSEDNIMHLIMWSHLEKRYKKFSKTFLTNIMQSSSALMNTPNAHGQTPLDVFKSLKPDPKIMAVLDQIMLNRTMIDNGVGHKKAHQPKSLRRM